MPTPEDIAYAESVRAIDEQSRTVDELRSRTGVLLTGASIVVSFLGAAAFRGSSDFDMLAGLALLAFAGTLALCLSILWPRTWKFRLGAKVLLADWAGEGKSRDGAAMQGFIAKQLEENYDANETLLGGLYCRFQWAVVGLGIEVILWIVKLAQ
jgi:hypothetical protein